jgi:hypothetical protein
MPMGRERDVLRWDLQTSLLRDAIGRADDELRGIERLPAPSARERDRAHRLAQQLDDLQQRLRALGPSPRAKMG